ncbi:MAG: hypothetical protein CV087_10355 [Candidatus Brocadia sp. WS118]|nr:MAG: hypothetical protein CV087_10355 [Candidatus Brocadia sp. WS118]
MVKVHKIILTFILLLIGLGFSQTRKVETDTLKARYAFKIRLSGTWYDRTTFFGYLNSSNQLSGSTGIVAGSIDNSRLVNPNIEMFGGAGLFGGGNILLGGFVQFSVNVDDSTVKIINDTLHSVTDTSAIENIIGKADLSGSINLNDTNVISDSAGLKVNIDTTYIDILPPDFTLDWESKNGRVSRSWDFRIELNNDTIFSEMPKSQVKNGSIDLWGESGGESVKIYNLNGFNQTFIITTDSTRYSINPFFFADNDTFFIGSIGNIIIDNLIFYGPSNLSVNKAGIENIFEAADTNALKIAIGKKVYLKQLSSGNSRGGGDFVYLPKHTISTTYNAGIVFGNWVRDSYLKSKTIDVEEAGAKADNGSTTNNQVYIQNAINFLNDNGGGTLTFYGAAPDTGKFYVVSKQDGLNCAIELKNLVWIKGFGGSHSEQGPAIKLADDQNCWVFETTGAVVEDTLGLGLGSDVYWNGGMSGLRINCNGANNSSFAGGINAALMGETSYIRDMHIVGIVADSILYEAGLRIRSGAPGTIENVSVFPASGHNSCGYLLVGGNTNIGLISGDGLWPFIHHVSGRFTIADIKVEYSSVPAETSAVIWSNAGFNSQLLINSGYINTSETTKGIGLKVTSPDGANIGSGIYRVQNSGLKYTYINSLRSDTLISSVAGQSFRGLEWGLGTAFRYIDGDIRFANTRSLEYVDDAGTARNALYFASNGYIYSDARVAHISTVSGTTIQQLYSNRIETDKEIKANAGLRIGGDPHNLITASDVSQQTLQFTSGGVAYSALRYLEGIQFYPSTGDSMRFIFSNPISASKDTSVWISLH